MQKLMERFASTNLSTCKYVIHEVCSTRYTERKYMGDYVHRFDSILDILESMLAKRLHGISEIWIQPNMGSVFDATVDALRTIDDEDQPCDDVTSR